MVRGCYQRGLSYCITNTSDKRAVPHLRGCALLRQVYKAIRHGTTEVAIKRLTGVVRSALSLAMNACLCNKRIR